MIYDESPDGKPIDLLGAYCPNLSQEAPREPPRVFAASPLDLNLTTPDTYHSSAPLEGVSSVDVFQEENCQACRGIMLKYENGGLRAVGQCRIGVDATKLYSQPLWICFRTSGRAGQRSELCLTEVSFDSMAHHGAHYGWQCTRMQGLLQFWFSERASKLSISPC